MKLRLWLVFADRVATVSFALIKFVSDLQITLLSPVKKQSTHSEIDVNFVFFCLFSDGLSCCTNARKRKEKTLNIVQLQFSPACASKCCIYYPKKREVKHDMFMLTLVDTTWNLQNIVSPATLWEACVRLVATSDGLVLNKTLQRVVDAAPAITLQVVVLNFKVICRHECES